MEYRMDNTVNIGDTSADVALADDIAKALVSEVYAYNIYQRLAEIAPGEEFGNILLSIAQDEAKHYSWIFGIIKGMGIAYPELSKIELPESFDGYMGSCLKTELDASKCYLEIAFQAVNPIIQKLFMFAAHDEHRHATWFQYILHQLASAKQQ